MKNFKSLSQYHIRMFNKIYKKKLIWHRNVVTIRFYFLIGQKEKSLIKKNIIKKLTENKGKK